MAKKTTATFIGIGLLIGVGLLVAHNITPGMADPKFLAAITTHPDLETVLYQQGGGVSVTLKKRGL